MAKENGQPTAEEKGKGKMVGHAATNGEREGEGDNSAKPAKDLVKPEENKDGMSKRTAVGSPGYAFILLTWICS